MSALRSNCDKSDHASAHGLHPSNPVSLSTSMQYCAVVEALRDANLVRGIVFIVFLSPQACMQVHSCTEQGGVGILSYHCVDHSNRVFCNSLTKAVGRHMVMCDCCNIQVFMCKVVMEQRVNAYYMVLTDVS